MKISKIVLLCIMLPFSVLGQQKLSTLPPAPAQTGTEIIPEYRAGSCGPGQTCGVTPAQLASYTNSIAQYSGDCTGTSGVLLCTKTNGVPFAPSATIDATNATNISAGTLAVARGGTGASTLTGPIKGNGTAALSAAAAADVYGLWSGTCSSSTFLRGDGACAAPAGSGSVTSVGIAAPGIFTVSGSPVTSSGTLTLTASGNSGGIPYFSSATALASSPALTANQILLGGGAGGTPTTVASLGTTTTLLHGNAAGAPTFGAVALGTDVSGTLLASQGGFVAVDVQIFTTTGANTWTKPTTGTPLVTRVFCTGAGGSGGGGTSTASGTANSGGAGGGSGALVDQTFQTSMLGATETVTIGTGATGGAVGVSGTQGGNTSFGAWFTAYGGGGGQAGASAAAAGSGASGTFTGPGGTGSGGTGGALDTNGAGYSAGSSGTGTGGVYGAGGGGGISGNNGGDGGISGPGPSGGGGGGGVTTGPGTKAGGNGGFQPGFNVANGGVAQTNGGSGTTTGLAAFWGGRGGGGGGSTTTSGTAGTGGNGVRGGGGGGGGSANTGGTRGAGGNGGNGYCAVATYF